MVGFRASGGRVSGLYPLVWVTVLALTACGEPAGLVLGGTEIPYRQIEAAESSLRQSFPMEGRATLIWHLLDGGLAAEALLHARLPAASAAAHQEAEGWARRLRAGEDFGAVHADWMAAHPDQTAVAVDQKPGPAFLGASVAAAVAAMEPGEWRGPLRTEQGWEILHLASRLEAPRPLAQVRVDRLTFHVGTPAERAEAKADWARLPLGGNPELLDALPLEFRRQRTSAPHAP